jgi:hypothetical protein
VAAREQSFQIAEAGIEYYRWHLAHNQTDFKDGTATSGPYRHDYLDKDGNKIGEFELTITPPTSGSTVVTVQSKGTVTINPRYTRILQARLAKPSLAKYAFAMNADMRFGEGTIVYGQVHSNQGIRFDGVAHNLVTSALDKYCDPDHGCSRTEIISWWPFRTRTVDLSEFGVHTHVYPVGSGHEVDDPLAAELATTGSSTARTDVFMVGRSFPVPEYDFNGLTTDFLNLKGIATSTGYYRPRATYLGGKKGTTVTNALGYQIVLRTDKKFDLYVVKQVYNDCGAPSWSIYPGGTELVSSGLTLPVGGVIYLEDNVWVKGTVNASRITIVAQRSAANNDAGANIIINEDVKYTNYDGKDSIALIAEHDVNVGQYSEDDLQIDAALVAKNGRVGREHYYSGCTGYRPATLRLFGMIASNERYGFAYTDNTGYINRLITYDGNLLYAPPPSFPLTADQYQVISWTEL